MDWNPIVSILTQIGTLVTILSVYLTLREMRNQRKASLKPDLLIPESSFHGYGFGYGANVSFEHLLIPGSWSLKEDVKEEMQLDEDVWLKSAPLTLYNVGFGVAKNIELKWTIQYDKTLQQIKDYCYKNSVPIIIEQDEKGFSYSEAGTAHEGYYLLQPQTVKHDFLMPASITSAGLVSYMPDTYKEVVSLLLYLRFRHGLWIDDESGMVIHAPIVLPSVELELLYDDVENAHYSKGFEVLFTSYGSYCIVRSSRTLNPVYAAQSEEGKAR